METEGPGSKERKIQEDEAQKQLLKATTSSNMSALKVSLSGPDCTSTTEKPFIPGEESNLPAAKDICHETLGEVGIRKWYVFLLWLAPSLGELVK